MLLSTKGASLDVLLNNLAKPVHPPTDKGALALEKLARDTKLAARCPNMEISVAKAASMMDATKDFNTSQETNVQESVSQTILERHAFNFTSNGVLVSIMSCEKSQEARLGIRLIIGGRREDPFVIHLVILDDKRWRTWKGVKEGLGRKAIAFPIEDFRTRRSSSLSSDSDSSSSGEPNDKAVTLQRFYCTNGSHTRRFVVQANGPFSLVDNDGIPGANSAVQTKPKNKGALIDYYDAVMWSSVQKSKVDHKKMESMTELSDHWSRKTAMSPWAIWQTPLLPCKPTVPYPSSTTMQTNDDAAIPEEETSGASERDVPEIEPFLAGTSDTISELRLQITVWYVHEQGSRIQPAVIDPPTILVGHLITGPDDMIVGDLLYRTPSDDREVPAMDGGGGVVLGNHFQQNFLLSTSNHVSVSSKRLWRSRLRPATSDWDNHNWVVVVS
ncbi:MAG: hypothetical protein LQ339_004790 [Xanthoria mediterranea]|nr:MAG: hypothetical protein LQ339_004790 [Xanthoria mediterranea]